jgi:hypothetical protein
MTTMTDRTCSDRVARSFGHSGLSIWVRMLVVVNELRFAPEPNLHVLGLVLVRRYWARR